MSEDGLLIWLGALLAGVIAAALTLGLAQRIFAATHSPASRALIASVYTVPAVVAGYHAALGLSRLTATSSVWRQALHVFAKVQSALTDWRQRSLSWSLRPTNESHACNFAVFHRCREWSASCSKATYSSLAVSPGVRESRDGGASDRRPHYPSSRQICSKRPIPDAAFSCAATSFPSL